MHSKIGSLPHRNPEPNCSSNYTGQTKCRLLKRVIQHNRTDKNSHLLKHSSSNNHHRVWMISRYWGHVTSRTSKERSVKLFSSKKRNLTSMFKNWDWDCKWLHYISLSLALQVFSLASEIFSCATSELLAELM